ncbi:MAG: cell wall metabolism sensor histidine kinase WalK, partial [Pseudorhodoplanes sp.]|nr:cell wall metabolism sensor histidine kinase WalK [Pseudorhodoplanes sp.]
TDTRAKGGTGLGLSISKSIVDHLGGNIWIENDTGPGTTFSVSLPVSSEYPEKSNATGSRVS